MRRLILIALLGALAQLVDGTLGMAYGVTASTALLITGITPAVASASVHLAEVGTTLASGISHWRFGNVDWRVVALIGAPGAVGAFAGATFLSSLSTESASVWVAGLLLLLGVYILARFARTLLNGLDVAAAPRYAAYGALVLGWAAVVVYGVKFAAHRTVAEAERLLDDERDLEPAA